MVGSEMYSVHGESLALVENQRRGGVSGVGPEELERVTAAGAQHGHVAQ